MTTLPDELLPALASVEDVCAREGLDPSSLSDIQRTKIERLLVDASAKVRRYTKQDFTIGVSTVKLNPRFRSVSDLPQKPVIRIIAEDGRGYHGDLDDWCPGNGVQEVTYEHGYTKVPADIVAVVCGMVQRTMNVHQLARTGVASQQVGPYSISFAGWATGGNLTLSPEERRELKTWRTPMAGSLLGEVVIMFQASLGEEITHHKGAVVGKDKYNAKTYSYDEVTVVKNVVIGQGTLDEDNRGNAQQIDDTLMLYFPDATPDIKAVDHLTVRGELYEAVGDAFLWRDPFTGVVFGSSIRVKRRQG